MKIFGGFVLAAALACIPAEAGTVTFTLDPVGGTVAGAPGGVVGWGFTIDSPVYFLEIDSFNFVPSGYADGTFVDYSGNYSNPVGPSPEVTDFVQSFDPIAQTGAGEFDIDPSAVVGAEYTGAIQLTYDLYNVDPNSGAFTDDPSQIVSLGNVISANAEIDVVSTVSPVPEPRLAWLAVLACVTAGWRARAKAQTDKLLRLQKV